jgi:enediyne biosynthesis protein E4
MTGCPNVRLVVSLLLLFSFSCSSPESKKEALTLFSRLDSTKTDISFTNTVVDSKDYNIFTYRNFYNGGGVAIGDMNNDGLPDIYFTANMQPNKLYLNKGNWKFEDITAHAGVAGTKTWSTGVAMADVNADGWLDIYVCNSGDVKGGNKENELFINNGDLTFTERAAEYGLADKGYSTHASFFDFDGDGDLDCYLLNNSFKTIDRVDQFYVKRDVRDDEGGDKLFRNDDGHFTDVSVAAGIYGSEIGFGLGISVSDLNGDMLPDMYVSNDFWERDYLYINRGNGTFSEEIISRTGAISASSMGSDVADLDNDGDVEIFTTEMLPGDNLRLKTMTRFDETNIKELKVKSSYHYQHMQNCVQWNYGDGNFQELANVLNMADTDWSWGCLLFDMNNDGNKDVFVANGIYRDITSMDFSDFVADRDNIRKLVLEKGKFDFEDLLALIPSTKLPNYAFINEGDRRFTNSAAALGLGEPSFSNGSAYGDLDNDGDLDLIVNNVNMPAFIYRNNTDSLLNHNYLKVSLRGPAKNINGIGAKVFAYSKGKTQVLQNFTSRGFESSVEPKLLFGIDGKNNFDSLITIWPDRKKQTLTTLPVNGEITIDYSKATEIFNSAKKADKTNTIFDDVTMALLPKNAKHAENEFNDFDQERLLPRKFSAEGPRIINGDCNNDGLEDFVLLGGYGDDDKLFIQSKNGKFHYQPEPTFFPDSVFESICGVFVDVNKDGYKDLIIGSGGNELNKPKYLLTVRLYTNDGKGHFKKESDRLPVIQGNFSCILAEDFDNDGDDDLFFGGHFITGSYGLIPESVLMRNDCGPWTNITPKSLQKAGMVTGGVWSDVNNDSKKDLVIAGEWMPVKIFMNQGNSLSESKDIANTEGLWNTISRADLNRDGLDDFVLGNWGLNTRFKASAERPMNLYVNDFDQNGKSDFIITMFQTLESKGYPFASKSDLTSQLPVLKKRTLKYSEYSTLGYEELFTLDQKKDAAKYSAVTLQSSILINDKAGNFTIQPLPLSAQVSPVFAISTFDYDGDSILDILLCGNIKGIKHEIERQDANRGVLLKGIGDGSFKETDPVANGLFVDGDVRDTKFLRDSNGNNLLLIGRNDDVLLIYKIKKAGQSK